MKKTKDDVSHGLSPGQTIKPQDAVFYHLPGPPSAYYLVAANGGTDVMQKASANPIGDTLEAIRARAARLRGINDRNRRFWSGAKDDADGLAAFLKSKGLSDADVAEAVSLASGVATTDDPGMTGTQSGLADDPSDRFANGDPGYMGPGMGTDDRKRSADKIAKINANNRNFWGRR